MAIPTGEIFLLKNVPLTSTYEHTIDFKDKNEQFNYFIGFRKYTFDKYTYIRKEREFLTFELPIAYADDINYMIFRSSQDDRLYYAFVGNKRFINQDVTEISFIVDVMQTFMFDYKFNASYIRNAHVDRWTAEHKPIYSKTDEGLAYGDEYVVESGFRIRQSDNIRWLLVSVSDYRKFAEEGYISTGGNVNPAPSPFACFLVPLVLKFNNLELPYTVMSDGKIITDYNGFIKFMRNSAFGDYVQSITMLSYNPFGTTEQVEGEVIHVYGAGDTFRAVLKDDNATEYSFLVMEGAVLSGSQTLAVTEWNTGIESSLPTEKEWEEIKQKPYSTPRDKRFESKLLCAPYKYNLLTDWRTTPAIIKNEYLSTDKIELMFSFALSYNAPFRFWIKNYKRDVEGRNSNVMQAMGLEFPVISQAYYSYMLQNKNTIQTNIANGIINASMGVVSGMASGGVGGALMGAFGGVVNVATNIRSENAKQQDLKAVPPSITSNDSSFNVLDNNTELCFYRMGICCENEQIIADIFHMTGYKVNRVEVPNLRSRTRFNYIQTSGANITGSFSQTDIDTIKAIFDRGITIWHYNNVDFKPLDYSFENIEVNLI